jgi:thiamine-phosphate pyrophosphorylase
LDSPGFVVYAIVDAGAAGAFTERAPDARVAIQLRDRAASGAALYQAARALVAAGHRVYVNERVDVALAAGCEGVQLPRCGVAVPDVHALAGEQLRVGVSLHTEHEVPAARTAGADFAVLAPIFPSPGKGTPLGLPTLADAARHGLPIYALGGVDSGNAAACLSAGAQGVAAIRGVAGLIPLVAWVK